jgi:hypothetical protein
MVPWFLDQVQPEFCELDSLMRLSKINLHQEMLRFIREEAYFDASKARELPPNRRGCVCIVLRRQMGIVVVSPASLRSHPHFLSLTSGSVRTVGH